MAQPLARRVDVAQSVFGTPARDSPSHSCLLPEPSCRHTAQCKEARAPCWALTAGRHLSKLSGRGNINTLPTHTASQSCTVAAHSHYSPRAQVETQSQSESNDDRPQSTQLYTSCSCSLRRCWAHIHTPQVAKDPQPRCCTSDYNIAADISIGCW